MFCVLVSYPIRMSNRSMVTETGAAPDPGSKEWNYGMAMQGA
jgi:hypothetical protein